MSDEPEACPPFPDAMLGAKASMYWRITHDAVVSLGRCMADEEDLHRVIARMVGNDEDARAIIAAASSVNLDDYIIPLAEELEDYLEQASGEAWKEMLEEFPHDSYDARVRQQNSVLSHLVRMLKAAGIEPTPELVRRYFEEAKQIHHELAYPLTPVWLTYMGLAIVRDHAG